MYITSILLITYPIFTSAALAETNLVLNPSFENGTTTPLKWVFVTQNANTPVWDTISYTGSKSVKISISGTTSRISGYPKSDIIEAQPITIYAVSAWGKTSGSGGTNTPAVRIVELDANKVFIRQNNLPVFSRGTNDWAKKKLEFQTDNNTRYLYVYANIWNGYGTFWMDDVTVSLKNQPISPSGKPQIGNFHYYGYAEQKRPELTLDVTTAMSPISSKRAGVPLIAMQFSFPNFTWTQSYIESRFTLGEQAAIV